MVIPSRSGPDPAHPLAYITVRSPASDSTLARQPCGRVNLERPKVQR